MAILLTPSRTNSEKDWYGYVLFYPDALIKSPSASGGTRQENRRGSRPEGSRRVSIGYTTCPTDHLMAVGLVVSVAKPL
jgi:hypothetical protein